MTFCRKNLKKNIIANLLACPMLLYAIYLLVRIVGAVIQTRDFPNEYREAANVAMTQSILNGINPYRLDTLSETNPAVCYLYGPLMSIIAAIISMILPFLTVWMVHYIISFISMVVSGVLVGALVNRYSRTYLAPVCAFTFTLFCHWRYGYVYAAPDSFGLLLIILCLFVMSSDRENAPILAAFIAVMTFFTKQYYAIVAITGAIYYLFVSKRALIKYVISGIVTSVITFGIIMVTCPLYLTYALYFLKGPGVGAGLGKNGTSYNNMQISYLGGMLLTLFILFAISIVYYVVLLIKKELVIKINLTNKVANKDMVSDNESSFISFGGKEKEMVRFLALFYIEMFMSGILLRYIGNNQGAFLSYYLQLFVPALIVVSIVAVERIGCIISDKFADKNGADSVVSALILAAIYVIFIGYTIYKVEPRLIVNRLSDNEMGAWEEAYELLDEHCDGEIYFYPPLDYYAYAKGMYVYNDGQPFVITEKYYNEYNKSSFWKKLCPYAGQIMMQHLNKREEIRDDILNGRYSLVTYMENMDTAFSIDDLSVHYKKEKTLSLRTGNWAWDIEFWVYDSGL